VARARPVALSLVLVLAGCGATGRSLGVDPDLAIFDLQARLGARAASFLGQRGPFLAGAHRFEDDCTGFVEAVYELEGIPLRALMREAAPDSRSGVEAARRAVQRYGAVLGAREWPAPGDLVFWHDTYDRNGNGRSDDRLTHLGIVEYVVGRTVVFFHRGAKGVARGAMTTSRPDERSAEDGTELNSAIRVRDPRLRDVPVLAGALFAGYGRIDPAKLPRPVLATAR
jgi:hypothetical protein